MRESEHSKAGQGGVSATSSSAVVIGNRAEAGCHVSWWDWGGTVGHMTGHVTSTRDPAKFSHV